MLNNIIIGSGPCSLGFLIGAQSLDDSLLITSESISLKTPTKHPKLHLNNKCVINPIYNNFGTTNSLGGLSSVWGGLLPVLDLNKLKEQGRSESDCRLLLDGYLNILKRIFREFKLYKQNNDGLSLITNVDDITVSSCETYMISSDYDYGWEKSGINIYPLVVDECNRLLTPIIKTTVLRIYKSANVWGVECSNFKTYFSKNLILGAGGIGNMELLVQYCSDFSRIKLHDHTPLQILSFRFFKSGKIRLLSNLATPISGVIRSKNELYTIYAISQLSPSFLKRLGNAGFLFLLCPSFFRRNIYLVQYWNDDLKEEIFSPHQKKFPNFTLKPLFYLASNFMIPLFFHRTSVGQGFHYMSNTPQNIVDELLQKHRGLKLLGGYGNYFDFNENPTLTFMADAYVQSNRK